MPINQGFFEIINHFVKNSGTFSVQINIKTNIENNPHCCGNGCGKSDCCQAGIRLDTHKISQRQPDEVPLPAPEIINHLYSILIHHKCPLLTLKASCYMIITSKSIRSCLYAKGNHSSKTPPFVFSNYHIRFCLGHPNGITAVNAADCHNNRVRNST